jgi:hypothetical protein
VVEDVQLVLEVAVKGAMPYVQTGRDILYFCRVVTLLGKDLQRGFDYLAAPALNQGEVHSSPFLNDMSFRIEFNPVFFSRQYLFPLNIDGTRFFPLSTPLSHAMPSRSRALLL